MCLIQDLPLEIILLIFKHLNLTDILHCSRAYIKWEGIAVKDFIIPQFQIWITLDPDLKRSLTNKKWIENCDDTALILSLWEEFQPFKGNTYEIIVFK